MTPAPEAVAAALAKIRTFLAQPRAHGEAR
jgi:hypothetical protein